MKVYLVGGAVRDKLLGIPSHEKDWVVVGETSEEMIKQGYIPVGKDFPVFLDPKTKEECALARTERKVGKGYAGFAFNASPDVTLEEDLKRRDLTINAMAEVGDQIIDPYGGREDIKNKILRHVSDAFAEDPVRILRIGRFAARYAYLGFKVADETVALMKQMVAAGEVDALVAERVWKEWERALSEKNPEKFFEVLSSCGAAEKLFPSALSIDALTKAAAKTEDTQIRFAVLLHTLSENQVQEMSSRYKVPSDYRDLALLMVRYQSDYQQACTLNAEKILSLLQSCDAFRREQRFNKFLEACAICFREELFLRKCFEAAKSIDLKKIINKDLLGNEIAEKIKQARVAAINEIVKSEDGFH